MEDQVAALTARGVSAAFLGSAQSSAEVKRKAWAGEYQLLYITPELATNNTAALQQLHATRRIGLIAIDEAHCVSEWCAVQVAHFTNNTSAQSHVSPSMLGDVRFPRQLLTHLCTQQSQTSRQRT
eukprot:GHRQ01038510.1.p3 GENE.GHRQ01038510.1~~GHRQ01038510.1.p3  ORF type:complete len:125 (+),score=36.14 GHRQ01038510.1:1606-1980(+)